MSNVASHFVDRHLAEGRGDQVAVRCEDRTLTYRQLRELVDRTGNALRELGVEREQRVLMVCLDQPEFVGTFWGAIKIGAVPVPVNTLLRAAAAGRSSAAAGRGGAGPCGWGEGAAGRPPRPGASAEAVVEWTPPSGPTLFWGAPAFRAGMPAAEGAARKSEPHASQLRYRF